MRKILVIDDEKPTLSMFQLFLKVYGYTVFTAENGEEGLKIFQKEKPSMVITDIKMPGMDGLEVLKKIKELSPKTEVIIITGHGDVDLTLEAMNLNATDFINKPIQKKALDSALKRAQERISLLESNEKEVSWSMLDHIAVVDIQGNINASHEDLLMEIYDEVEKNKDTPVLLRFSENSSVSGAGIGILIQILSRSLENQQKMAMTGLSDNMNKFFEIVGINKLARIFPTQEEAVAYLKGHEPPPKPAAE
ncbi:response regulator [Desulfonatronovibrio hydrogenovorans]|uniref:response regulator n=1 Tax=Desulfonatronovibrio hydrogenovorans TaxID=53245 RepID=UPI00048CF139|nr:response regulator [Desulfonatronovibrio hydrogenovorans]